MCLRTPTEPPSCLHGPRVCVGRFKGQGYSRIALGSHFCAQAPQAGPLWSEPQFPHLEDGDDPKAQNEGLGQILGA